MDARDPVATSTLFAGLTPEERALFVPLATPRGVPRGEYLFRLGDRAGALFVVRSGIVDLTMPLVMRSGDREVVVEEAHAGDTVGWSALIEPYRCTMSARAGTDAELLAFDPDALKSALRTHADEGLQVVSNIAKVIAHRLQVTHTMWTRELQRTVFETFG